MKERTSFAPRLGPYYKQNPNKSTHSIIPSSIPYSRPPPIILASTTPYCPRLLQHRHYSLFIFTRSTTLPEIISTTMIFTSLPFTSLYDTFPARCVCVCIPFHFKNPAYLTTIRLLSCDSDLCPFARPLAHTLVLINYTSIYTQAHKYRLKTGSLVQIQKCAPSSPTTGPTDQSTD